MRNEIKLNLDLFKRSPHLRLRCTVQHTHSKAHIHACTHLTHPWSPSPCQHPSREIRRLETGQPWPMYIFMGLIWHHFSLLPEKEMYLIYTIPIWPAHQGEIHRESMLIVMASPLQQKTSLQECVCGVSACASLCMCVYILYVSMQYSVCVLQMTKKHILSYSRPVQYTQTVAAVLVSLNGRMGVVPSRCCVCIKQINY